MQLQIDTRKKTIKVEENVSMLEFMSLIQTIFSKGEWTEYTLETNTVVNVTTSKEFHYHPSPYNPLPNPYKIYCGTTSTSCGDFKTHFTTT